MGPDEDVFLNTQAKLEKAYQLVKHLPIFNLMPIAIDLFAKAGLEKPDISILDEAFLADFEKKPHVDLRLKLLQKLLEEEIFYLVRLKNPNGKALSQLLQDTIMAYHNRVITAAEVARVMVEAKKKLQEEQMKKEQLGLSDEEMVFTISWRTWGIRLSRMSLWLDSSGRSLQL